VRHIKLVIFLAVLGVGAALFMMLAANDASVRGQDPNVEARGTNTAGAPLVGTSGATDPAAGSTAGHDGRSGPRPGGGWQGDGGWVSEAAGMSATEIALAGLAERRATSSEVKMLAAELRRDHTASSEELKGLATRKQWAFPQSIDTLHAQALQALDRSQSSEFDRAYVDAMVASHEKALASFRIAATSAGDPELKAWAAKQLPTLEEHLEHARRLR
jgi:putative membrane protein